MAANADLRRVNSSKPTGPDVPPLRLPNASKSLVTYRVRGIPLGYTVNGLRGLLLSILGLQSSVRADENSDVHIRSLAISPDRKTKTATVDFDSPPACLSLDGDEWSFPVPALEVNGENGGGDDEDFIPKAPTITIDTHFKGITTLRSFKNLSEHKIDCIAISGLGGHAFGSFKGRGKSYMWLRDSLPFDLPGARIMLYGYDTQVAGSNSFQDLEALSTALRSHLQILATWEAGSRPIPLIFIAHSLGGIIVKGTMIQLKRDPDHQAMLASIYGALFFGVPNQGMDIASLVAMVKDQPNQALLHVLGTESQLLREQCRQFSEAFEYRDSKVVCFYETLKTPTAELHEGRWRMSGPPTIFVNSSSATHGRYWENEAHYVQALNRTHSDLVKFSSYDGDYERVLVVLKDMAASAVRAIPRGHRTGTSSGAVSLVSRSAANSPSAITRPSSQTSSSTMPGEDLNLQALSINTFSETLQQGKTFLNSSNKNARGENLSNAEMFFSKALGILTETRADPADFIKVYNGLMHVHLDLTFDSNLSREQRESHLQTAIAYNDKSGVMAQRSSTSTGVVAQVALQRAVLYGRSVQLRAKRGLDAAVGQSRLVAIQRIEDSLEELLRSDHESKAKSIAWGKDWRERLRRM